MVVVFVSLLSRHMHCSVSIGAPQTVNRFLVGLLFIMMPHNKCACYVRTCTWYVRGAYVVRRYCSRVLLHTCM